MSSLGQHLRTFSWRRELERFPFALLGWCGVLLGLSLVLLSSAALTPDGRMLPYLSRQMIWASAGLMAFLVVGLVPYGWLGRRSWVFYAAGILSLLLVFAIGTKVNGSRRWFAVGPLRIQPSEFMKYVLVIVLAHVVAGLGRQIRTWKGLATAAAVTGIPFLCVCAQPDLGTSLSYLPILGSMVFVAGARLRHLGSIALAALASVPLAWTFALKDYQKMRVYAFLDTSGEHALGGAYQTTQSVIAIGSGGLLGRGHAAGTQGPLGFLPERHTDFIFGVLGEDFGLVGGLAVLAAYACLLLTLLQIAQRSKDLEGRLIATGVAAITFTQLMVNVGMAMGLTPVTGLTLPLVSYGGSSLLASMAGFGLVASVARRRPKPFAAPDRLPADPPRRAQHWLELLRDPQRP